MENIALVTIKFPYSQTSAENSSSGEECQVAPSPTKPDVPGRGRPSTKNTPSMAKPDSGSVQPSIGVKFLSAGLAACYADLMTFPLDTAKVRLQAIQYTGPELLETNDLFEDVVVVCTTR